MTFPLDTMEAPICCDNSLTRFQFNVDITSGYNITCVALTETSDERLKDDIDVVRSDCSEIVKKIKVKKYYEER